MRAVAIEAVAAGLARLLLQQYRGRLLRLLTIQLTVELAAAAEAVVTTEQTVSQRGC